MARREFFPCYHSYFKKCEKLTDQELGRLFRALMMYSSTGERQELAGRESIAFDFIADDIDRAEESYLEKCEKNSQNGKLGGRPKKHTVSKKPDGFSKTQKSQYEDEDEDEDEENTTTPSGVVDSAPARAKTAQPTFEQVREVAKIQGCPEIAKPFFDYYAAAGWRDSEGKPCAWNWQQKLVAWRMREENRKKPGGKQGISASYDYEKTEGSL